jgi:hypothetical protein
MSSRAALRIYFLLLLSLPGIIAWQATKLPSQGHFVDITEKSKVRFQHVASHTSKKYLPETMGSGVALFDYDNDGRLDIFLANGATLQDPTSPGTIPQKTNESEWNRLYHQKPDGTFEDVTRKSGLQGRGYGMGVAVGDFDNDGFEDIYVTEYGGNRLYRNKGDGTFEDVTAKAGVGAGGWSTSAAWVDLDNDGLLDLVVLRYMKWDFTDIWCGEHTEGGRAYCHPNTFEPISPVVFHNDGDGRFSNVTDKLQLGRPGKGLGIAIADYDLDGRIDLFVANDSMPEFLYHNNGNGQFEERGLTSQVAVDEDGKTFAGMGADFGDYNNDGYPDLIVDDLSNEMYALFENNKDGTFNYVTRKSGLGRMSQLFSGWGVKFFDYDNDGWKDLIVAQGHDLDTIEKTNPHLHYREPMLLARNKGQGFKDVSAESGDVFREAWVARGLATGDLDNDGRVDFVVTTNGGPAYVLHNETQTANHWLSLRLVGHKSNRDAMGAVIKVMTKSCTQYSTVSTSGSYLSSSDKRAHFGLGADNLVDRIEIRWPSGVRQVLTQVKTDQILTIEEGRSTNL